MARLPAAPGAYGQPPVPPADESKQRTPASSPAATLASAVPRVSWKWKAMPLERDAGLDGEPGQRRDLARHADADRVAEADLVDAEVEQAQGDVDGCAPARRDRCTGSRTRSRRSRAATSRARAARARTGANAASDSSTVIPMLACGEGVGRGGEDGDGIGAGGLGAGQAALVRDEDRVADAGPPGEAAPAARRRRRAAGSPSATTKRVASISRRPASARSSMKRALVAVGIGGRLVLEAVARPDLVDPDALGHGVGGRARWLRPSGGSIARSMPGDLDLDPAEQVDRGRVLRAAVRRPRSAAGGSRDAARASASRVVGQLGRWPSSPPGLRAVASVPERGGQGSMSRERAGRA